MTNVNKHVHLCPPLSHHKQASEEGPSVRKIALVLIIMFNVNFDSLNFKIIENNVYTAIAISLRSKTMLENVIC